ncbi:exoribonuclease family protein [Tothia fuscella]|uniref:Ribosomal RNA-processing protein 43 n=1 Tax=Tothia fuscella TaxID=1048955 RepID=A0A9P4TS70_9PEZI|nr:exoribonuclease family protein [Tothia fuscella]
MASAASQPLSFPPEIFAALTPTPFLLAHLNPSNPKTPSLRANGRKASQFRTPTINTNSLTHCSGSAVVRLGDTAVVCGVRGEILLAKDIPNAPHVELPDEEGDAISNNNDDDDDDVTEITSLNLLVPNIELATGCSPAHLPGNPPSTLAQSLSQRLLSLLNTTRLIRASDLRIMYRPPTTSDDDDDTPPPLQVVAYWTLYIDILMISLDGNPFDSAWGAILSALQNTILPKAWWDPDLEILLCSDRVSEGKKLKLRGSPVASTFVVFEPGREKGVQEQRTWILADPDSFEEGLCRESVTVVVDYVEGVGRVRRIEKGGGVVVGRDELGYMTKLALGRWSQWDVVLQEEME